MIINVVRVFLPSIIAFIVGIFITPILTNYLYKNKMWKKKSGKVALDGKDTPIFNELHKHKEVGTPKMGGVVVWASTIATAIIIYILGHLFPSSIFSRLDFISRGQTWLPLAALLFGSLAGLVDDYLEVNGGGDHIAGGLSLKKRLLIVTTIGLLVALWFYYKLGVSSIGLPVVGSLELGAWFILLFVLVTIGIYSGGVIDGIDGLSGGIFSTIFAAYAGIAFYQHEYNLAAFCAVVVGSILAFLWFNIPPARFYMSETGMMGLTITLTVVAFMTDTLGDGHGLIVLPIIAMPLIITTLSDVIQVLSKKYRGKKVFLVAPIHHHFEALGWPPYKVVMRFWVVGVVFAILGMALGLIGL